MMSIKGTVCLVVLAAALAGCNWGIVSPYEDASDARDVQPDRPDTVDVDADPPRDPDGTDIDTAEPDATDGDPAEPDNPPDPIEDDAADVPDTPDTPDTPDAPDTPDTPDLEPDEIGPTCGDGHIDPGETCDDGPANSDTTPDACRTDCTPARCGDAVIDTGETCDDGPANSDTTPDACRTDCTPAGCGDGIVDTGEDCDGTSGFCIACVLGAPTGWVECTDSSGNPVFYNIFDMPGNHSHDDFRDQCITDVQALAPEGFAWYGLAVFSDQAVWDCVSSALNAASQYYIGLQQDRGASDYVEPAGGWYWVGYNGTSWSNLSAYDPANTWIDEAMDNGGGTGNVDCGRLTSTAGNWTFSDYSCTSTTAWQAICMVQF
jgi:hypothetical protein